MKHPDKILSTTEFVLWLDKYEKLEWRIWESRVIMIRSYAQLMQTPLSLEMFVPVKDRKVLEKPKQPDYFLEFRGKGKPIASHQQRQEYEQARKKILFEGWEYMNGWIINKKELDEFKISGTLEQLINTKNLTGTDSFWNKIFKP